MGNRRGRTKDTRDKMVYAHMAVQTEAFSIPGLSTIEKTLKSKFASQMKKIGCAVVKIMRPPMDRMLRSALGSATGGISVGINYATRGITGVASMFGIGKGPTDIIQWGEDQIIHYIGC